MRVFLFVILLCPLATITNAHNSPAAVASSDADEIRAGEVLAAKFEAVQGLTPALTPTSRVALPGGQVFVGGALLAYMDTDDQLAGVLGHEIEHIALSA